MKSTLLLFTTSAILAVSAQAANVIWNPVANITADTDVDNTGTLVNSANFGAAPSSTTVNGVTFSPFAVIAGTTQTIGNTTITNTGAGFESFDGLGDATGISAAYNLLLSTEVYAGGPPLETLTLTLSGLTIGESYLIQFWSNDSRAHTGANTPLQGRGNQYTAGISVSGFLDVNTTDTAGGRGTYVVGNFIADATSQVFVNRNPGGDLASPTINAFQLRAIPEPSAVMLCGLGLLGLLSRRRRNG